MAGKQRRQLHVRVNRETHSALVAMTRALRTLRFIDEEVIGEAIDFALGVLLKSPEIKEQYGIEREDVDDRLDEKRERALAQLDARAQLPDGK